ncbi:alkaline phosphatase [Paramicrobacterium humi]|uniref:Alkaline phosphatase n=1 Tax=Paramicrobacterium humi TaxID=640635 RepID=A0A1H4KSW6_9MICO|nr:alkaline phosphatase [Microbacterium humi]SEB61296.1 alkaline phosphatase [Microbacterium humi]
MTRRIRRLGSGALAVGAAAILGAGLLAPSAALADVTDTGGAARHDDDRSQAVRDAIADGPAKNVILLIGDGMGDSEITIARNYAYGAAGMLPGIDALPLTGQYTTYSVHKDGDQKGKPDYVPDSAATGTAWATGTKSYDGAIGVDVDGNPHDSILELAKANGLRTGNVSTAEIQDATPAVQIAHVDQRKCYGPDSSVCGDDALEKGGLGSISEQLLNTRADVILGGGTASFEQTAKAGQWEGATLFEQATDRGYQVATTADQLKAVTKANQSSPLLGLFTPGNFPTRYSPSEATVGGANGAPIRCTANPSRLSTELSLASLTNKAIGLLDRSDSDKGFFLQVEGASIDKQDHSADACGQIGETIDLDEAVQAALEFAKKDGNTLVIVTADHAHTSQIVDDAPPATLSTALTTADGSVMKVAYGTAAAGGSQQHTGAQLRIAGYGPGAANVVGLTDQTDTFFTMSNALGLNRDAAALSAGASITLDDTKLTPGEKFSFTATGFNGDRQVSGLMESEPVELGAADVIDGAASYTATAPAEEGTHTLTVTGAQTDVAATLQFTVTADGVVVVPGDGSSDGDGDPDAAAAASGNTSGTLPWTGAEALPFLVIALLLVGIGGVMVLLRRRGLPMSN